MFSIRTASNGDMMCVFGLVDSSGSCWWKIHALVFLAAGDFVLEPLGLYLHSNEQHGGIDILDTSDWCADGQHSRDDCDKLQ